MVHRAGRAHIPRGPPPDQRRHPYGATAASRSDMIRSPTTAVAAR